MKRFILYILISSFAFAKAFSQTPELVLPVGHVREVSSAQFSPDGKLIITASGDATIKIWEASSLKLLKTLIGHSTAVNYASFTPDGKKIVSYCYDGTAKVWEFPSYRESYTLKDLTGISSRVYISPDSRRVLAIQDGGTAGIWDIDQKKKINSEIKAHNIFQGFSHDGKYIATEHSKTGYIWNGNTGKLLRKIELPANAQLYYMAFPPVANRLLVIYIDAAGLKIRSEDILTGASIKEISMSPGFVPHFFWLNGKNMLITSSNGEAATFSQDKLEKIKSTQVDISSARDVLLSADSRKVMVLEEGGVVIYDVASGKLSQTLRKEDIGIFDDPLSELNDQLIMRNGFETVVYDLSRNQNRGNLGGNIIPLTTASISHDGKQVIVATEDERLHIVELATGQITKTIEKAGPVNYIEYSPNGDYFVTTFQDNTADSCIRIWSSNGSLLHKIVAHDEYIGSIRLSHDGTFIVSAAGQGEIKKWNASSGKLDLSIKFDDDYLNSISISRDDKLLLAQGSGDLIIYELSSGKKLTKIQSKNYAAPEFASYQAAEFSPLNNEIVVADDHGRIEVYDAGEGKLIKGYNFPESKLAFIKVSKDGKFLAVIGQNSGTASVLRTSDWQLLYTKQCNTAFIQEAEFSPDSRSFVTGGRDQTVRQFDAMTAKEIHTFSGHAAFVRSAQFTPDGSKIVSSTSIGEVKIWETSNGRLDYTFVPLQNDDFIVFDSRSHYDGTNGARKLLYFTCGTEIIELEQLKDQLWVTGLAGRIMRRDSIQVPSIAELKVCGLTPQVENLGKRGEDFFFKITPRRGGLGETALFINNIEVKRYQPGQLKRVGVSYELAVKNSEFRDHFISGQENPVSVKAYTSDNVTTSRSVIVDEENTGVSLPPNLYAVMVGVSDYKGDELDLTYAAKDANDLSSALAIAARKLLNKDGKEHVFIYNLTTSKDRHLAPEKKSIKNVLAEIGRKALPSDILLIFFAGHGMTGGQKKQFYFLTADASKATAATAADAVGISTAELTEWMKPQNIKAQKRVLIFDACNSGQMIRDFVKMGKEGQDYVAARDDEKGKQLKAIEDLNSRSGLFILSASASNQSAYEMSRYSQGVLTYALLKAMKLQPAVLENGKLLNLGLWFNEAERSVKELSMNGQVRQQPQLISTTNFNIGEVDKEVMARIILPNEKPLFLASNLQNTDEAIAADDLGLNKLIDSYLSNISSRGQEGPIVFIPQSNSEDAYNLGGRYEVKENNITARIILRQKNKIMERFELTGSSDKLEELARAIAEKASSIAR